MDLPVMASIALWWVSSTIAGLASKNVMNGDDVPINNTAGWTTAFQDLRWVDLTVLQHLLGMGVSVAWLHESNNG